MCDFDPGNYINYGKEPQVMFWNNDMDCNNKKFSYLDPGLFNCEGTPGCQNTAVDTNAISGVWVPPTQYVYMWNDYQRMPDDLKWKRYWPLQLHDIKSGNEVQTWKQSEADKWKPLCSGGRVAAEIVRAQYKALDGACKPLDIRDNFHIKNVLGKASAQFPDPDGLFSDPCGGHEKAVEIEYKCGLAGTFMPFYKPNGVYASGTYPTLETNQPIEYYNDIEMPPVDGNGEVVSKYDRAHKPDTIQVVRKLNKKPWNDYLYDCCFAKNSDSEDYNKCGRYGRRNKNGELQPKTRAEACSVFLDGCNAEDIKSTGTGEGRCHFICKDGNDAKTRATCDRIKNTFCATNPEDKFCDCINVQTRDEYKKYTKLIKESGFPELPNPLCLSSRCSAGKDLFDVFLRSTDLDYVATKMGSECPDLTTLQNVNVSGSNNNLTTNMAATNNVGANNPAGSTSNLGQGANVRGNNNSGGINMSSEVGGQNTTSDAAVTIGSISMSGGFFYLFLFVMLIVSCGGGYYLFRESKEKKIHEYNG